VEIKLKKKNDFLVEECANTKREREREKLFFFFFFFFENQLNIRFVGYDEGFDEMPTVVAFFYLPRPPPPPPIFLALLLFSFVIVCLLY
jgi:hypothetical protein